jgi:hypothetical protein
MSKKLLLEHCQFQNWNKPYHYNSFFQVKELCYIPLTLNLK